MAKLNELADRRVARAGDDCGILRGQPPVPVASMRLCSRLASGRASVRQPLKGGLPQVQRGASGRQPRTRRASQELVREDPCAGDPV